MKLIKKTGIPNRYFASKYDDILELASELKRGERYELVAAKEKQTSIYRALRRRAKVTNSRVRVFMHKGVTNLTPIK